MSILAIIATVIGIIVVLGIVAVILIIRADTKIEKDLDDEGFYD